MTIPRFGKASEQSLVTQNPVITRFKPSVHLFKRHDLIALEPDQLWVVQQGVVKTLTWNDEGTVITLGYWGAGDVVGKSLSNLQTYEIECLTRVKAQCLSLSQSYRLSEAIVCHLRQTEELLSIIRTPRVSQRLQQFLSWLARKFGRPVSSGQLIDIPVTHQELAEMIGTTRVTITRIIKQFEEEGIISRPRRYCIVLRDCSEL
ncbi:Crp/Fnr family transcriptional regulator [Moorena sp. SIO3H5]|uniref:Crp/Fnr family transcriptional regulator n=1 Tax=Moorena sp. SIO3H5 TaxID=2607834 RepID=UPI0013BD95C4|nr:Crp/Fnr family transcriptional regulator [Moorena sp. SIO3H5]NEO71209.1 Crp/Fnr family transcriptional regulator [Moorena sp. SIO3H5]